MREQNHFLDLLIQASPMGVVIMTLDGEVSQLNPMAVKMLGVRREEAQNKKLADIDSPLAEELASIPKRRNFRGAVERCEYLQVYPFFVYRQRVQASFLPDRAHDG